MAAVPPLLLHLGVLECPAWQMLLLHICRRDPQVPKRGYTAMGEPPEKGRSDLQSSKRQQSSQSTLCVPQHTTIKKAEIMLQTHGSFPGYLEEATIVWLCCVVNQCSLTLERTRRRLARLAEVPSGICSGKPCCTAPAQWQDARGSPDPCILHW